MYRAQIDEQAVVESVRNRLRQRIEYESGYNIPQPTNPRSLSDKVADLIYKRLKIILDIGFIPSAVYGQLKEKKLTSETLGILVKDSHIIDAYNRAQNGEPYIFKL